ncbi:MAG: hypothetical protein WC405_05285 [Syntrophales bacterium]
MTTKLSYKIITTVGEEYPKGNEVFDKLNVWSTTIFRMAGGQLGHRSFFGSWA